MEQYTAEQLRRIRLIDLEIYEAIADVCEAHGLRYYAGCGTTLGAVLYQGFIPWDDDMDVCMPRKDYEEFLRIAPGELPEKLEILGIGQTKGYVLPFAKVHNRETTFVEATDTDRKYHSGVFVDAFPMDAASSDKRLRDRQFRRCRTWIRACVLTEYRKPKLPGQMNGIFRLFAGFGCAAIHALFGLTGRKTEYFYRKYLREARRYEQDGEPDRYRRLGIAAYSSVAHLPETLFPTKSTPFGSTRVRIPNDADTYLKDLYGDYRTPLPPEKQRNHFPAVLDFRREGKTGGRGQNG